MFVLNNSVCPRKCRGKLIESKSGYRCTSCNACVNYSDQSKKVYWVDAVDISTMNNEMLIKKNISEGKVWCPESGAWVVPAITPPQGQITKMEQKVEKIEKVIELSTNPMDVFKDAFKAMFFTHLRKKDKSTYRPK